MDKQQFFNGAVFDAYRWFGAHLTADAAVFRTFAPNASRITLTGAMNGWTETDLHQDGRSGFWEVSVPGTQASRQMPPGTALPGRPLFRRPGLSGEAGRWKRCLLTAPAPGCKVIIFHILSADRMSLCEEAPHEAETFRLH